MNTGLILYLLAMLEAIQCACGFSIRIIKAVGFVHMLISKPCVSVYGWGLCTLFEHGGPVDPFDY